MKADPQAKHYGYPEPQLTYKITSGSLLPGDEFTGNLVRVGGEEMDEARAQSHGGSRVAGSGRGALPA